MTMRNFAVAGLSLLVWGSCCRSVALAQQADVSTISIGVPLRVQIDRTYPLKTSTRLEGHLIEPVYVKDRLVLPVDTLIFGVISGKQPIPGKERASALLDGDFTPLATAKVVFDSIEFPDQSRHPISTAVAERTASIVEMSAPKPSTLKDKAWEMIRQRRDETLGQVTAPHKYDRMRQYVYGQLPYHPQEIWFNTQFDAELTAPMDVPHRAANGAFPIVDPAGLKPVGTLRARLTDNLSSRSTKAGTPVVAILSAPLFDKGQTHILVPEGTRLTGSVVQSSAARRFARNGKLRFVFRKMELDGREQPVHGMLTGAESGEGQNLAIDTEGSTKPRSPNKVIGTLVLGGLAAMSLHHEHHSEEHQAVRNGVASGGFGILTRVAVMASGSRNVASGFAFYALSKNLYSKWIARGKDVTFPRDTRIEIDLAER